MSQPHKHAELIKVWADGAEIEYLPSESTRWRLVTSPCWDGKGDYRIKPKPDVVRYVCAATEGMNLGTEKKWWADNLKLTFDGETGKLKAAEVLQ
jgi:hypothetical protein